MLGEYLDKVRVANPLVHNITNYVTVNDVANVLLATGASPIMSDEPMEVEEMTAISKGLNINIGTLNESTVKAMFIAAKKAVELGHPVVLDPVGAGAIRLRTEVASEILKVIKPTVIRGNASEIKAIKNGAGTTKGVDLDLSDEITDENLMSSINWVKDFSKETGAIIAITGKIDLISDSDRCYVIRNGRKEMSKVTGTGCQLSALIAAFVASKDDSTSFGTTIEKNAAFISSTDDSLVEAVASAVAMMGIAGEIAYENLLPGEGNLSYRNRIIDAIYNMDSETINRKVKYEIF